MDYWKRRRLVSIIWITAVGLLVMYGCYKVFTYLAVDTVTIKYVLDRWQYMRGEYVDATSSKDPEVIDEWYDLMKEMDNRKLQTDDRSLEGDADLPFPCYLVEFRLKRVVKSYMMVMADKAVVYHWLWGSHVVDYGHSNPYYYEVRDRFSVMTTGEQWRKYK